MCGDRDDSTMPPRRDAPTLDWQAIVTHNLVVLQQGMGCRICVTVRLPVLQCGGTMYWQADANTPLLDLPDRWPYKPTCNVEGLWRHNFPHRNPCQGPSNCSLLLVWSETDPLTTLLTGCVTLVIRKSKRCIGSSQTSLSQT